jgi:hypothetical protein
MAMVPPDLELSEVVCAPAPESIADVISKMEEIDALLPATDGLKWFNRLYLMVTQQVDQHPPGGAWKNPIWLSRLDVEFAKFYFNAVGGYHAGEEVPSAWNALFEVRHQAGIDRIQFALAGMNAHINHDLALAILATDDGLSVTPDSNSPEHADYLSVNELLDSLIPSTLRMLASDTLGVLAQDSGRVGRLLAFWNICEARDLAWEFADHLRVLSGPGRDVALSAQDRMTGALGRAILCTP